MKHVKQSSNRIGDLSEYYAVTWLWDEGYEVFTNAGSDGLIDMIAWNPNTQETIFIDFVNHIQYIALKIYKKTII